MSKTPNLVNLLISFQALRLSFQRRTLRLYTVTVVLFDLAIVTENLRRVQLSFSFPSTVSVSAHPVPFGLVCCHDSVYSQLVSSRFFLFSVCR